MITGRIIGTLALALSIQITGCAAQAPPWDVTPAAERTAAPAKASTEADCREPIPDLFDRVSPAVVSISAVEIDRFEPDGGLHTVVGSGFIIGDDGLVLTNSHVVFGHQAITVVTDDGRRTQALLLGSDPIYDLAVLRIPIVSKQISKAVLGDSDAVRIGEDVLAIGNPLALEQTLTRGVVSGLNRFVPDSPFSLALPLIQTDAPINPGNSGGPLFNRCGEAIGITTSMVAEAQNIGFAIPINTAKKVIPQLVEEGRIIRPWFGISVTPIQKEAVAILSIPLVDGLLVEMVDPGSPAQRVGIRGGDLPVTLDGNQFLLGGDIIIEMNGQSPTDRGRFAAMVAGLKVGDTVRLTLYRDSKVRQVSYQLPERPLLPGDMRFSSSNTLLRREDPWQRVLPNAGPASPRLRAR